MASLQTKLLVAVKMKNSILYLLLLFLNTISSRGDEHRDIYELSTVYHLVLVNKILDSEDNKQSKEMIVANLPVWFYVYLVNHKLEKSENYLAIENQIQTMLQKLTLEEIRSGFALYLQPELANRSEHKWPVKNYNIEKFREDFPKFLALRD